MFEMDIFSAINFKEDRVIDGDFWILKDLVKSNFSEVSHNSDPNKCNLKKICAQNDMEVPNQTFGPCNTEEGKAIFSQIEIEEKRRNVTNLHSSETKV